MGMKISKNNKRISMKIFFYLGLMLIVLNSRSEAQGFGSVKPKTSPDTSVLKSKILAQDFYKTTFLDIFETDFKQELNYYDAQKACTNLGENWRLPTLDELEVIFKNSKDYTLSQSIFLASLRLNMFLSFKNIKPQQNINTLFKDLGLNSLDNFEKILINLGITQPLNF